MQTVWSISQHSYFKNIMWLCKVMMQNKWSIKRYNGLKRDRKKEEKRKEKHQKLRRKKKEKNREREREKKEEKRVTKKEWSDGKKKKKMKGSRKHTDISYINYWIWLNHKKIKHWCELITLFFNIPLHIYIYICARACVLLKILPPFACWSRSCELGNFILYFK